MILWLASYPRSGNTFVRIIFKKVFGLETRSVYGDTRDVGLDPGMSKLTGHVELPDDFDWEFARRSEEVFVIKTHDLFSAQHADDKAIVLIRDGRDATVSFLNHQRNFGNETTLEKIIDGHPLGFTWAEHEQSWREAANNHLDVLFLKFEDFTKNPDAAIKKLSAFVKLESKKERLPAFSELQQVNSIFFSSGRSGYFGDAMDEETQRYFWIVNGTRMSANGYKKNLPQNAKADQQLLLQYVSKHFFLVERNTQALMRENAFRMCAIEKLASELREFYLRHDAHSKLLNQLKESIEQNLGPNEAQAAVFEEYSDKVDKLYDSVAALSEQFDQTVSGLSELRFENGIRINAIRILEERVQDLESRTFARRCQRLFSRLKSIMSS
jgi:hypothetical protein